MSSHEWCKAVDGKEIDLFNPNSLLFTVDTIANVLARINRFAGHWLHPVSVARHSILVSNLLGVQGCNVEVQLQGLFHDAAEAFTTDIPSPLKRLLSIRIVHNCGSVSYGNGQIPFATFEETLLHQIFAHLEIEWPLCREVHETDHWVTEQECLWVRGKNNMYRGATTDPDIVASVFKRRAEELFNERAHANDMPMGVRK